MSTTINETHDPSLKSWIASANSATTDFPVQNLPYASFRRKGSQEAFRPGVAIGDQILDRPRWPPKTLRGQGRRSAGRLHGRQPERADGAGPAALERAALALSRALRALRATIEPLLVAQAEAEYATPARIGDYTDFYISLHHATAVGKQFRPDNPLLPNYSGCPSAITGAPPASAWTRSSRARSARPAR